MSLSKAAMDLVDKKIKRSSDKKQFLIAKTFFNRMRCWTKSQKDQLSGLSSVSRALKEWEYLKTEGETISLKGTKFTSLLQRETYSCREEGFASPATYQYGGTFWAEAVCNSFESQCLKFRHYPKRKKDVIFSRRQLIETRNRKDVYKHGDFLKRIPGRIRRMGGVMLKDDFPKKKSVDGGYKLTEEDKKKISMTVGEIKTFQDITRLNLQNLILSYGQIPVDIDMNKCMLIGQDILRPTSLKTDYHSVVVDGWTDFNGIKMWKIKNTWSVNCGDRGYFYIPMEEDKYMRSSICLGILTPV